VPRVSLSYRLLGRRGFLPWVRNAGHGLDCSVCSFGRILLWCVWCGELLTTHLCQETFKDAVANCTPLSDMTTVGIPYLAIMRSLNAFLSCAVALRRGTSSVHFENLSIMTSSIWFPFLDLGRGQTKSAHTVAHVPPALGSTSSRPPASDWA